MGGELEEEDSHTVQGLRVHPQLTHEPSPSELFAVSLTGPWDR